MAKTAFTPAPTNATKVDALSAEALSGDDRDLAALDRRSRLAPMRDSLGALLAKGSIVSAPLGKVMVLGPGRGRDALLVSWTGEEGQDCIGTLLVANAALSARDVAK